MGRHQPVARTYHPPRQVDWGKSVTRRRYMRRELTSVALIAYALVLLFGLWRLSQGEAAFEAWRATLSHPLAIFGHGLIFIAALYHTRSWFEVMPRTLPDSAMNPASITRAGWTAAAIASLLVLTFVVVGRVMKRSNEPITWLPFGAGGMLSALIAPVLVLVTGLLVPLGVLPKHFMSYPRMLAFAQNPLGKLLLLAVISLFLLHGCHRLVTTLHDYGLKAGHAPMVLFFGAAVLASLLALVLLLRIGF